MSTKKLYIQIMAHIKEDGNVVELPRIISAQTENNKDGSFKQLSGHVYTKGTTGKVVSTGAAWYWGLRNGRLYREEDGRGKVWMSLRGVYCAYEIAQAVEDAFKTGKGVISNPFEKSASKSAVTMPQVVAEDKAAIESDLVALESDGCSATDRLQAGDATLFVELGFPQVYAERWAEQIRSGFVTINNVEDVVGIRGIGKVRAEQLISNWHEKFEK